MKKSNVVSMIDYCYEHAFDSTHTEHIVKENEMTPIACTIQTHLNNLRATYGDDALKDVITLLGLDREESKKVA